MANPCQKGERVAHLPVELDATIGVVVECGNKVQDWWWESDGSEDLEEVFLGDGGEGRSEIEENTSAVLMHEGRVHGCYVLEDGAPPEETLLAGEDPAGEYGFPGVPRRTGDDTVISVDNVERSGVTRVEGWYVIGGCGMGLLREAGHCAVIVMVGVRVCRIVVSMVEGGFKVFLGEGVSNVK